MEENAIRNKYQELGVEGFYTQYGADYSNPHEAQIRQLLLQNQDRIDYNKVLDFCCGSGEVSRTLIEAGYGHVFASDPFTYEAYQKNCGRECWQYTFEDVIRTPIPEQFSVVICSFAMHLCPDEQLFPLVYQLFQSTSQLVIITPHKRPELEQLEGVQLAFEDFCLTAKGKQVRLKAYTSTFTY